MKNLSIKDLSLIDCEPRIKDIILGERLGLVQARNIKQVIEANSIELKQYGRLHAENASVKAGFFTKETMSYYLNEEQALLICMFSRTEKASVVRKELIDVYIAYRTKGFTKVKEHYRSTKQGQDVRLEEKHEKVEEHEKEVIKAIIEYGVKCASKAKKEALWEMVFNPNPNIKRVLEIADKLRD